MHHEKDMMLEPNPKMVFGDLSKRRGTKQVSRWEISLSECYLTNIDLVLDPRQAPEHSKRPMFL
jgi:hypothetical protein